MYEKIGSNVTYSFGHIWSWFCWVVCLWLVQWLLALFAESRDSQTTFSEEQSRHYSFEPSMATPVLKEFLENSAVLRLFYWKYPYLAWHAAVKNAQFNCIIQIQPWHLPGHFYRAYFEFAIPNWLAISNRYNSFLIYWIPDASIWILRSCRGNETLTKKTSHHYLVEMMKIQVHKRAQPSKACCSWFDATDQFRNYHWIRSEPLDFLETWLHNLSTAQTSLT